MFGAIILSVPSQRPQVVGVPTFADFRPEVAVRMVIGPASHSLARKLVRQDIFEVGVLNGGTNRNEYASHVCEVLYEHGFKGNKVWVQIIDIAKLVNS